MELIHGYMTKSPPTENDTKARNSAAALAAPTWQIEGREGGGVGIVIARSPCLCRPACSPQAAAGRRRKVAGAARPKRPAPGGETRSAGRLNDPRA